MSIPDLVDNRKHKLANVLRDVLARSRDPRLDVVTAFFNLNGLEVLEPEIQTLGPVSPSTSAHPVNPVSCVHQVDRP